MLLLGLLFGDDLRAGFGLGFVGGTVGLSSGPVVAEFVCELEDLVPVGVAGYREGEVAGEVMFRVVSRASALR